MNRQRPSDRSSANGTSSATRHGMFDAVTKAGATAVGRARSTARSAVAKRRADVASAADGSASEATGLIGVAAIEACRQFLFREARLLDERRFGDWLELWAPDARYSMPTRSDVHRHSGVPFGDELTGPDGVWWFDDSITELNARVTKLLTGKSWAEGPPSRTRRFVTNVEVVSSASPGSVSIRSNVLIYRGRRDADVEWYSAARVDRVDCAAPSATNVAEVRLGLIRERMIILDTNVIKADNLVMFL